MKGNIYRLGNLQGGGGVDMAHRSDIDNFLLIALKLQSLESYLLQLRQPLVRKYFKIAVHCSQ